MNSNICYTSRIKSWQKSPHGRLPVSCTAYMVEDSMEGKDGIEDSWLFTSHGLRYGAGVALHLDKIRPEGSVNQRGLVASGLVSFASVYNVLNDILRRGGLYKKGAITLHLKHDHPDIVKYLNMKSVDYPWLKRSVSLPATGLDLANLPYLDLLLSKIRQGEVWLTKIRYDKNGMRLLANVCLEILLPHRGTCLLSHVNLATSKNLDEDFAAGMKELCELHSRTGVGGHYLEPEHDLQVGLGVVGLASRLAQDGISYAELAQVFRTGKSGNVKAVDFVSQLNKAYDAAAVVARSYHMERAFTVAPTASCAYEYEDLEGYTLTPEISPPLSCTVDRISDILGVVSYDHNPRCETATTVDYWDYFDVADGWQKMMERTGLAHSISFNSWDTVEMNLEFLQRWYKSSLNSLYYRLPVYSQQSLDKTQIACDLSCASCAE